MNRLAVRAAAASGDRRAQILDRMLADRPGLINDMLVGLNFSTAAASVLLATVMHGLAGPRGVAFGALLLVLVILLFGEIVPKSLAYAHPMRASLWLAGATSLASRLFRPVSSLMSFIPVWLASLTPEQHNDLQVTEESLADMVRLGMQQGELSPESIDVVKGILAAADMAVGKLMTPLPQVISVPDTATTTELTHIALDSAFSRIAVFRHAPECIVGVVHVKDLFARLYQGCTGTAAQIMRPMMRTLESRTAADVLAEMRLLRQHIAVVVDHAGTIVGIVTIQDLLEDIVGEVADLGSAELGCFLS